MNELANYAGYTAITALLLAPAFWSRRRFSGENYSELKSALTVYYNIFCAFFHMSFFQTGTIPLYGPMDNSVLGWTSLAIVILHARLYPTVYFEPRWFLRKNFDPNIRKLK